MSDIPSAAGSNGRDAAGRFGLGNGYGKGNPHQRRVAELRSAMLQAVTADDVTEIVTAMITAAKGGDVQAAKLLLDRLFGRVPAETSSTLLVDLGGGDQSDEPMTLADRRERLRARLAALS